MLVLVTGASRGLGNAKAHQKALWQELKPLLTMGRFAAVQARVLWGVEEQVHMRPGHFWACELGDAGSLLRKDSLRGSPVLAGPFASRQHWPPNEGEPGWEEAYRGITRLRYDVGDCAILLRCYYHRTADDAEGLTFVRWMGQGSREILVINSCELRAVQGRQKNDFKLTPPKPPPQLRQQAARAKKKRSTEAEPPFDPKLRWRLARELDANTRIDCNDS